MSDDRIQQELDAYADHLQHATAPAPAREIRRRAAHRRRNQAAAAAFTAALLVAGGLGAALNRAPERPSIPVAPASPAPSLPPYRPSGKLSDVSQLRELGIDLEIPVLIDVADDAGDLWMQIGPGDVVDFTGSVRDASTEMLLQPAPLSLPNRVLITPPGRPGMCVAATAGVTLALQVCQDGADAQTWRMVPAGDSGQFELEGQAGILEVDQGLVRQNGRTGLQTLR